MKEAVIQTVLAFRGEILAILSILIAIVIAIRSRKFKSAYYVIETNHLVGSMQRRFRGLEILYNGNRIESFSASKVFLWNGGSEPIRGTDIAPAAPLVISPRDREVVLDHKVLYCSWPHSRASTTSREDGSILIDFDYLDPREGVIFEVLHTGGPASIFLSGSVIGGGQVQRKDPGERYKLAVIFGMYMFTTAMAVLLMWGIVTIFPDLSNWTKLAVILVGYAVFVFCGLKLFLPSLSGGFLVEKLSKGYAKHEKIGASPTQGD